ncbi:MAG: hypothetical protein R3F51_26715 [Cyanobacteriota/Melainabacteria group bacterium]
MRRRTVGNKYGNRSRFIGGVRSMCATAGGGFALMTEAVGMAGIMEVPVVCVEVQRGGPNCDLPTKDEQA